MNLNASDPWYWEGLPQVSWEERPGFFFWSLYKCWRCVQKIINYCFLLWGDRSLRLLSYKDQLAWLLQQYIVNTLSAWTAGVFPECMTHPTPAFLYMSMSLSFLHSPTIPISSIPKPCRSWHVGIRGICLREPHPSWAKPNILESS